MQTATSEPAASSIPPQGFGTPITREAAQAYLDNYDRIQETLAKEVLPTLQTKPTEGREKKDEPQEAQGKFHPATKEQLTALFGSGFNGFMFSREAVERLFNEGAEYLLILQGAKLDTSLPTVVLVGCESDDCGKSFTSVAGKLPGTEQPPHYVLSKIPSADKSDKMCFELYEHKDQCGR
jgi:hypothetical protein